jgi:hypothetical protein
LPGLGIAHGGGTHGVIDGTGTGDGHMTAISHTGLPGLGIAHGGGTQGEGLVDGRDVGGGHIGHGAFVGHGTGAHGVAIGVATAVGTPVAVTEATRFGVFPK